MAKETVKALKEERPEDLARRPKELRQLADGREAPSSIPMEPPLGYKKQPTIFDQVRAMVRSDKLKAEAMAAGMETFEEADDFDQDEDEDPRSPYEDNFDPIPEADRRALRRELPAEDDPELQRLIRPTSKPAAPVEGAAGGSPDPLPDAPAGPLQRVREHLRRRPQVKDEDPGERQ